MAFRMKLVERELMNWSKQPMQHEAQEQQTLFQWAALSASKYPELALLYRW